MKAAAVWRDDKRKKKVNRDNKNMNCNGKQRKDTAWEEDIDQGRFLGIMVLLRLVDWNHLPWTGGDDCTFELCHNLGTGTQQFQQQKVLMRNMLLPKTSREKLGGGQRRKETTNLPVLTLESILAERCVPRRAQVRPEHDSSSDDWPETNLIPIKHGTFMEAVLWVPSPCCSLPVPLPNRSFALSARVSSLTIHF